MTSTSARGKFVGGLLALLLMAGACSSGGDSETNAEPAADPAGVLRLGADLSTPLSGQFDLISAAGLGLTHEYLYGTLLKLTPEGKVEPNLAESAAIVDASNLVIKLRPGLKFSDGTVLDSEALKFSMERTITQAKPGAVEGEFLQVDTLTVSGPLELKVKLKTPIAGAFYRLLRLAETSPVSPTAVKAGVNFDKNPVGAGPFKLNSFTPGVSLKLDKNPDYWNAKNVRLAGIEYVNVTAQALTNAIQSETIDFASPLTAQQARALKGTRNFTVTEKASSGILLQGLWCKNRPPFDNIKVRQALNYAVNKEALNTAVYNGQGEVMDGFNSSGSPFFDPALKDYYKYNPTKAKQLLAEAGVPNLTFEMFYAPGSDGQLAAEVIQRDLLAVGVKVSLKPLSNSTDFYPNATGAPINITPVPRIGIPKVTRVLTTTSFGNICTYNDPELNNLVLQLQGVEETSPAGVALWKKVSENGLRNAVHLFLLFGTDGTAVSDARLGGVTFYEGRFGYAALDVEKVFVKA